MINCGIFLWSLNETIAHLAKMKHWQVFVEPGWDLLTIDRPNARPSVRTPAIHMFRRIRDLSERLMWYKWPACYVRFITIFWLHTTFTMHFSKLIFSVLAFATVSVSLNVKVPRPPSASGSCDDWCPKACFDEYGGWAYHCIIGYDLFHA